MLILESAFAKNPYPEKSTLKELAQKVELDESRVYSWFAKKRNKLKNLDISGAACKLGTY